MDDPEKVSKAAERLMRWLYEKNREEIEREALRRLLGLPVETVN